MLFTSFLCGKRAITLFHSPRYDNTSNAVLQVFFLKIMKNIEENLKGAKNGGNGGQSEALKQEIERTETTVFLSIMVY